jgi:hypothetical protein
MAWGARVKIIRKGVASFSLPRLAGKGEKGSNLNI